ncbi:MAG: DUF2807 domain-containing protein [Fibrella sp.]|nr:DUF2807 domain-containing protein [Armatimonadota bacterium]
MKRKHFGLLLVCLFGAAALASIRAEGAEKRVKGSGVAETDPRPVSDVRQVSVHGIGTLTVEIGTTESLTIEADDNILPYIQVKQNGAAWEIGPTRDASLEPQTPIHYRLRVTRLDALTLSGATKAELKPLPHVAEFDLSLSGATSAQFAEIDADTLKVNASGASRVEINAGSVKQQTIHLSGASRYRAFALRSETASIHGSGTSNVEITATRELNVDASGVTQVHYKGAPPVVKSDTSGVSSVKAAR